MKTPYEVLGVSPTATDDEIKQAYRALARKYHPDKYRDSDLADLANEKMKEINAAYEEIQKSRSRRGGQNASGNAYNGNPRWENAANADFAQVRRLINDNRILEAEQLLHAMQATQQTAEWFFLMGCVMYKRGYFLDAQRMFDRACAMDPNNSEYRAAREQLKNQASTYGTNGSSCCDCCVCDCNCCSLLCADSCCECMGGDLIPCC